MRTYNRARELAVRHALGAGRGRILQQLLAESLQLTLSGGLLGIGLAYAGVRALLAVLPATFPLPRLAEVEVDGRVLLLCLGVSLIAGITFGIAPAPGSGTGAGFSVISDGYFHAMGIPLIAGREFDSRDRIGSVPVAVINRAAARMLYPGEDPIGKQLAVDWDGPPQAEIVGVASDSLFEGVQAHSEPFIFLPNSQRPNLFCGLLIRTAGDPATMIAAVREAIHNVDPEQGVMETSTMERRIADSVAQPRLQTILLGVFGLLALVLACIGIYGVLAYAVSERMREIGVRVALGATPGAILRQILSNGLSLAAAGLFIGLGAALALTRYLEALLYSVRPTDPAVFALAIATLLLVAASACYFPARRAARVDPIVVLREE